MSRYSVIVGNIGTIDHYPTKKAALKDFAEYKRQSKAGHGKAAFESVILFDNDLGEPIKEYIGTIDNNEGSIMSIKTVTNNKPRPLIYGYELTDKEKSDFDYMEDLDYETFVRYQGMTFAVGDFMRLSDDSEEAKQGWHGVYGMNAFCGVLIKLRPGAEYAVMGKVLC